jgi:subtilisin family serine protease
MRVRLLAGLAAVTCTAAFAPALASAAPPAGAGGQAGAHGKPIRDAYIVVLKRDSEGDAGTTGQQLAKENGGRVDKVYRNALKGFSGTFTAQRAESLRHNPKVAYVEQDTTVTADATETPATWGLDRIDQRTLPLNSNYDYTSTGAGVNAYVIDTGIHASHSEFTGRVGNGYDAVTAGGTADDCNGHGTHVAGTIGGTTYGVAKQVTLHPVRVLDCSGSGSNSGVIAGIDWVKANHVGPSVANMSLGGGASTALDTAVNNAIGAGVTFSVAAGNDNLDACNSSPARTPAAITVGATTNTDSRASYSNYGNCLDVFAPGSSITSAWNTGDTATNTISGTSMATPHVTGVAALALSKNAGLTPAQVRDSIVNSGSAGTVSAAGTGSPNVLLYSGLTAPATTPPPVTPAGALLNPGFESGPGVGWAQTSSGGYQLITADRPRAGSYGAWTGGYNGASESLSQQVTVPSNGTFGYWYRVESQEAAGATAWDTLEVRVYSASGQLLATPRRLSNATTRNTWAQDKLPMAAYAGQKVTLRFQVKTDSTLPTSFYLDDTSL